MIHALKIFPEYFEEVRNGRKKFELRYNDRDFRVGDYLALNEWDNKQYTGRTELVKVTYILNPNEFMSCQGNFVVMSIELCGSYDSVPEDAP
nr:MAG TPA: activating signal cointegrator [Caudoviricetes sp.]